MDINPYQAPPALPEELVAATPVDLPNPISVEGRFLLVNSFTILPPICIKTNRPVSPQDMVTRRVYWCTPLVLLLILIGPLFVLIGYLLARRKCTLTFGLSPEIRRRSRRRRIIASAIAATLFVLVILAGGMSEPWVTVLLVVLLVIAMVVALASNLPIAASKYRHGTFWIKGCSPEYLAGIREHV